MYLYLPACARPPTRPGCLELNEQYSLEYDSARARESIIVIDDCAQSPPRTLTSRHNGPEQASPELFSAVAGRRGLRLTTAAEELPAQPQPRLLVYKSPPLAVPFFLRTIIFSPPRAHSGCGACPSAPTGDPSGQLWGLRRARPYHIPPPPISRTNCERVRRGMAGPSHRTLLSPSLLA